MVKPLSEQIKRDGDLMKPEIVEYIHDNANISRYEATLAVDAIFEVMQQAIADGRVVKIVGFGKFTPVTTTARRIRNPQTGELMMTTPNRKVKFLAGKTLDRAMHETEPKFNLDK